MRVKELSAYIAIKIKVGAQLRRGPEDDAEEGPVRMDRDEVAAGIGDDAAAIAVTQREAGTRVDIPIGEKSIDLCLLVEGLIVRRRGRRGGARAAEASRFRHSLSR